MRRKKGMTLGIALFLLWTSQDARPVTDEKDSLNPDFILEQGIEDLKKGKLDDAFLDFTKVTILAPSEPRAYYYLGIIYYVRGNAQEEIESYQKAISIDPAHFDSHLALGHAYLERGELQKAMDEYHWVIAQDPDRSEVIYNLALIYKETGFPRESAVLFKRYLELNPKGSWSDKAREALNELDS